MTTLQIGRRQSACAELQSPFSDWRRAGHPPDQEASVGSPRDFRHFSRIPDDLARRFARRANPAVTVRCATHHPKRKASAQRQRTGARRVSKCVRHRHAGEHNANSEPVARLKSPRTQDETPDRRAGSLVLPTACTQANPCSRAPPPHRAFHCAACRPFTLRGRRRAQHFGSFGVRTPRRCTGSRCRRLQCCGSRSLQSVPRIHAAGNEENPRTSAGLSLFAEVLSD